jgi:hypothetical protein
MHLEQTIFRKEAISLSSFIVMSLCAQEQLTAAGERERALLHQLATAEMLLAQEISSKKTLLPCVAMCVQEQLTAAGDREHSLQHQLATAEMRLEEAAEAAGASAASEQEGLVQRLVEQRDAANTALQVGVLYLKEIRLN